MLWRKKYLYYAEKTRGRMSTVEGVLLSTTAVQILIVIDKCML